jgi:excisionase family DNA binding protein
MRIYLSNARQLSMANKIPRPPDSGVNPCPPTAAEAGDDAATTEVPPAPPFLSLREAADWLCVSPSTLKRMVVKGELPTVRVGKRRKIPAGDLAAYVAKGILLPENVNEVSHDS